MPMRALVMNANAFNRKTYPPWHSNPRHRFDMQSCVTYSSFLDCLSTRS